MPFSSTELVPQGLLAPFGRFAVRASFVLGLGFALVACDQVAKNELKVGQSSKEEVQILMGKPEMIWEEKDGSLVYEYPRGPEGRETYMVTVSADGKYQGMVNILTEATFAKIKPGMTRDQIRRILGKPTSTIKYELKQEESWTWRYAGVNPVGRRFHVNFDLDGIVKSTEASDDPKDQGGGK
jgi:outer membrane protein assembly factor BamE (lipoprotein component of BamABCDE complex)